MKKNSKTNLILGISLFIALIIVIVMAVLLLSKDEKPAEVVEQTPTPTVYLEAFGDARNAIRSADILSLLNATTQYLSGQNNTIADFGEVPSCPDSTTIGAAAGNVDLGAVLVPLYLASMPTDPQGGTADDTQYTICTSLGRITIAAPLAENGEALKVTR
jgi:hypothetical protein